MAHLCAPKSGLVICLVAKSLSALAPLTFRTISPRALRSATCSVSGKPTSGAILRNNSKRHDRKRTANCRPNQQRVSSPPVRLVSSSDAVPYKHVPSPNPAHPTDRPRNTFKQKYISLLVYNHVNNKSHLANITELSSPQHNAAMRAGDTTTDISRCSKQRQ